MAFHSDGDRLDVIVQEFNRYYNTRRLRSRPLHFGDAHGRTFRSTIRTTLPRSASFAGLQTSTIKVLSSRYLSV